jgi:hypothetical protein
MRARPPQTPAAAPAHPPKATPVDNTAAIGHATPSDCEVENAWSAPNAQPSQITSASATTSSTMIGPGRNRRSGSVRRMTVKVAVTANASPTSSTASHGRVRSSRATSSTMAVQVHAAQRKAARPWRIPRSTRRVWQPWTKVVAMATSIVQRTTLEGTARQAGIVSIR